MVMKQKNNSPDDDSARRARIGQNNHLIDETGRKAARNKCIAAHKLELEAKCLAEEKERKENPEE